MNLTVTRSKTTKSKMLGGSDTYYVMHLRASIPEGEALLLKKYSEEGSFDLSDDTSALLSEGKLEGPKYINVEALKTGIEYKCKFVAKVLSEIPIAIIADYERRLGRIRAHGNGRGKRR